MRSPVTTPPICLGSCLTGACSAWHGGPGQLVTRARRCRTSCLTDRDTACLLRASSYLTYHN